METIESCAEAIVTRHLAGRSLPDEARAAIVQAVAEHLREDGLDGEHDLALQRLVETYADVAAGDASFASRSDDNPPTTTDMQWTSIG